jgi:hypothetical protein
MEPSWRKVIPHLGVEERKNMGNCKLFQENNILIIFPVLINNRNNNINKMNLKKNNHLTMQLLPKRKFPN